MRATLTGEGAAHRLAGAIDETGLKLTEDCGDDLARRRSRLVGQRPVEQHAAGRRLDERRPGGAVLAAGLPSLRDEVGRKRLARRSKRGCRR